MSLRRSARVQSASSKPHVPDPKVTVPKSKLVNKKTVNRKTTKANTKNKKTEFNVWTSRKRQKLNGPSPKYIDYPPSPGSDIIVLARPYIADDGTPVPESFAKSYITDAPPQSPGSDFIVLATPHIPNDGTTASERLADSDITNDVTRSPQSSADFYTTNAPPQSSGSDIVVSARPHILDDGTPSPESFAEPYINDVGTPAPEHLADSYIIDDGTPAPECLLEPHITSAPLQTLGFEKIVTTIDIPGDETLPLERLADSHVTNAPLQSLGFDNITTTIDIPDIAPAPELHAEPLLAQSQLPFLGLEDFMTIPNIPDFTNLPPQLQGLGLEKLIPTPNFADLTNLPLQLQQGLGPEKFINTPDNHDIVPAPKITPAILQTVEAAIGHLIRTDETGRMGPMIAAYPCPVFSPAGLAKEINPFESLCLTIMGQQVSRGTAKAIQRRFMTIYNGHLPPMSIPVFPSPWHVKNTPLADLRLTGLSNIKAEYIHDLAEEFDSGRLSAKILVNLPDDQLFEKLLAVRGLGPWAVEMFALFELKRMDVFSLGDMSVQRGMAAYSGVDVTRIKSKSVDSRWQYMCSQDMQKLAAKFAPYRSLFMWYMWKFSELNVERPDADKLGHWEL